MSNQDDHARFPHRGAVLSRSTLDFCMCKLVGTVELNLTINNERRKSSEEYRGLCRFRAFSTQLERWDNEAVSKKRRARPLKVLFLR